MGWSRKHKYETLDIRPMWAKHPETRGLLDLLAGCPLVPVASPLRVLWYAIMGLFPITKEGRR